MTDFHAYLFNLWCCAYYTVACSGYAGRIDALGYCIVMQFQFFLHAPRKGAAIELQAWPGASVTAVHDFIEIGFFG
jgi:hypothetical protein